MFFLGRYPVAEMPHFFVHADVMVVSLKSTEIFALTIPSKIQSYMAFGKPIATMLDGMGSDIVQEAECGLTAPAGDAQRLADNVVMMSEMDETELARLGRMVMPIMRNILRRKRLSPVCLKLCAMGLDQKYCSNE